MQELIAWAQTLGAPGAAIFAFLYWRADAERKEMTKLLLQLIPETRDAIKAGEAAITLLRVAVGGKTEQQK